MSLEKNVLTFVNYSLVFFGVTLLIIGTILSEASTAITILADATFAPSFIVGILCLVTSFNTLLSAVVGLAGSVKEIKLCVLMFLLMMVLNGLMQGATIYFTFRHTAQLDSTVTQGLLEALHQYAPNHTGINEQFVTTWDDTQKREECCGVNSPIDWNESGSFRYFTYPDSCCKNMTLGCGFAIKPQVHGSGCKDAIITNTYITLILAGVVAFVLFVPETLGILSARHVLQTLRRKAKFARI